MNERKLVLEDGSSFKGIGFGSNKEVIAQINIIKDVYGYEKYIENQEGIILFTYPLIGNYGIEKSLNPKAEAIIVHELCDEVNHYKSNKTLRKECEEKEIVGLNFIDTREIAQKLYENPQKGIICNSDIDDEEALKKLRGEI